MSDDLVPMGDGQFATKDAVEKAWGTFYQGWHQVTDGKGNVIGKAKFKMTKRGPQMSEAKGKKLEGLVNRRMFLKGVEYPPTVGHTITVCEVKALVEVDSKVAKKAFGFLSEVK